LQELCSQTLKIRCFVRKLLKRRLA